MIGLVPEKATLANIGTSLPPDESYEQHRSQNRGAGEDVFVHAVLLNTKVMTPIYDTLV
jgi:hypothetical protein